MSKFTKRPVTIEARQMPVEPTASEAMDIYQWVEQNTLGSFEPMDVIEGREPYPASGVSIDPRDGRLIISTREGLHWVDLGDWVIQGVQGEFYPCKPEVFAETYEETSPELSTQDAQALARFTSPNFAVQDGRHDGGEGLRRYFHAAALKLILAAEPTKSRAVALTELETAMMWAIKAYYGAPGE